MKTYGIKRVNVTLSEGTLKKIDVITHHGNRSKFIAHAVDFYAQELERKNLEEVLKEGALARAKRDRVVAQEWFALDEEAWQKKKK